MDCHNSSITTSGNLSYSLSSRSVRVHVFVDFWNFQLLLNQREAESRGDPTCRFAVNWTTVGPTLAQKACAIVGVPEYSLGCAVLYTSYDPKTEAGVKFRRWVMTWLDLQPGLTVRCRERKPKAASPCPSCHQKITICPNCRKRIVASEEKGVDTLMATDMVRLAWEDAYDIAVLATSDRDLIPAVELVKGKGLRVIQAGFPPIGAELAQICWASFDVYRHRQGIERVLTP